LIPKQTNKQKNSLVLKNQGFARFCSEKYSTNMEDIGKLYVHLTNVSKQKHAKSYNPTHGGKWMLSNLLLHIEATRGKEATIKLGICLFLLNF